MYALQFAGCVRPGQSTDGIQGVLAHPAMSAPHQHDASFITRRLESAMLAGDDRVPSTREGIT